MKTRFLILFLGLSLMACTDDDGGTTNDNDISTADFLPLTNGNYWVYDVNGTLPNGTDSLYVAGDVQLNGNTYKQFMLDEAPYGFFSNAMDDNGVRKSGDRILLTGSAEVPFAADFPISINVSDFTILKENASSGNVLDTETGSIPYQYQEYTFDFNYTLTSTSQGNLATYTAPNGQVYNNVKVVELKLNLSVSTDVAAGGTSFEVTIMPAQDVLVSTRYFAEDIGVVHTATDVQYELNDFASVGVTLPIPQSVNEHQDEVLVNYQVN